MNRRDNFIVCQIGAREHYALARTLYARGALGELITDIWVPPGIASMVPGARGERLRGRYHVALGSANVTHFTAAALLRESINVLRGNMGKWKGIVYRNNWFQCQVVRHLEKWSDSVPWERSVLIAYSYAARDVLAFARKQGAKTILVQIDGGQVDEELIADVWARRSNSEFNRAPKEYWCAWLDECRLADRILVNSEWSRNLLHQAGIDGRKVIAVPVIYDPPAPSTNCRQYPSKFDMFRPLRVLMLGALTIRKGALELLDAARALRDEPVEFTLVGADGDGLGSRSWEMENVQRYSHVPRERVHEFYNHADVFLFPTHSDGFGMTQVEALASALPVIASQNCAAIVRQGETGLLLDEVSGNSIADAIRFCLQNPALLSKMSVQALSFSSQFSHDSAAQFLAAIEEPFGAVNTTGGLN